MLTWIEEPGFPLVTVERDWNARYGHDNDDSRQPRCVLFAQLVYGAKTSVKYVSHLTCILCWRSGTVLKIKQGRFGDPDSKTRQKKVPCLLLYYLRVLSVTFFSTLYDVNYLDLSDIFQMVCASRIQQSARQGSKNPPIKAYRTKIVETCRERLKGI